MAKEAPCRRAATVDPVAADRVPRRLFSARGDQVFAHRLTADKMFLQDAF